MNRRNSSGTGPKLELKLNLSPPRGSNRGGVAAMESPRRSASVSPTSSCVSSEAATAAAAATSPEATTSMMLVGCPRCLMYVMLSEKDPKCPKCKSSVLLDVLHDNAAVKTTKF